jgi:hypothetical protein
VPPTGTHAEEWLQKNRCSETLFTYSSPKLQGAGAVRGMRITEPCVLLGEKAPPTLAFAAPTTPGPFPLEYP